MATSKKQKTEDGQQDTSVQDEDEGEEEGDVESEVPAGEDAEEEGEGLADGIGPHVFAQNQSLGTRKHSASIRSMSVG